MNTIIINSTWAEKTSLIDEMLHEVQDLQVIPLPSGLEAETWHISSGSSRAVLKIWNKESSPDVGYQYALLHALRERGVSVSKPYGWGYDAANHKVLLMSYDGSPIRNASDQNLRDFARLLLELHRLSINDFDPALHRRQDFIAYFYPQLHEHQDIRNVLVPLVEKISLKQENMIHGDFNLWNILEHGGRYTIIDWTNAQLGDPRYDIAWAAFLIRIYNGEDAYTAFLQTYIAESGYSREELEMVEAIACLRWVLLDRIADVPKYEGTIDQVNHAIQSNIYLNLTFIIH